MYIVYSVCRGKREEGEKPISERGTDSALVWRMSELTRDGMVEPVSRDQILRLERGRTGKNKFPCSADHETERDWQPCQFMPYLLLIPVFRSDGYTFLSFSFFNLTYSRWTSSLPSCLWPLKIFPSLPGSRLTIFYRDASSALL